MQPFTVFYSGTIFDIVFKLYTVTVAWTQYFHMEKYLEKNDSSVFRKELSTGMLQGPEVNPDTLNFCH